MEKMSLQVTVKSAANLPNVERFSKSDPMTVLVFQGSQLTTKFYSYSHVLALTATHFFLIPCAGSKKKTKVIDNNLNPEWNEVAM